MQLLMQVLQTPHLIRKGEGAAAAEVAEVVTALMVLVPPAPLILAKGGGRRRMDFLVKSKFQSLGGRRAIQVMSQMPSDNGLGASPIMRTPI